MTTLVVDGYNAIYAIPDIKAKAARDLSQAREEIVARSREYARSSGFIEDVKVVFDGDDRYRYLDKLDIARDPAQVFSATAAGDDKIIEVVRMCARKGKVILASNDNYVRNNARGYGAGLIDSRDLAGRKVSSAPRFGCGRKKLDKNVRETITREYREQLGIPKKREGKNT
ncbi:MAG: NYN domain-containing protein [Candidatus Omnitrophica bacterium]|nr:NYN domain-containing protein [Candidatus Omnitrophota bacterium]MBU1127664.1 NYN domain-containing protein [Candidatus Omnitrophota bacterium]MBU1783967.1 NYN domain-containing protein [Candidatus Omnitrophota bacterium]MBU1851453.1 NYN domain-containing protein [Candidatus Omnitrophota bacterium]